MQRLVIVGDGELPAGHSWVVVTGPDWECIFVTESAPTAQALRATLGDAVGRQFVIAECGPTPTPVPVTRVA